MTTRPHIGPGAGPGRYTPAVPGPELSPEERALGLRGGVDQPPYWVDPRTDAQIAADRAALRVYTDPAHAITYDLNAQGRALMACRTCDSEFYADPRDTEGEQAPYDAYGDPWCGCEQAES